MFLEIIYNEINLKFVESKMQLLLYDFFIAWTNHCNNILYVCYTPSRNELTREMVNLLANS